VRRWGWLKAARLAGFSAILFPSVQYDGDNLVVLDKDFTPKPDGEPWEEILTDDDLDYSRHTFYANGQRFVIPSLDCAFLPEIVGSSPVSVSGNH
jgi:hypothetical protein